MGLFVEGHVCIQCEISITKSIVLAYSWKANKKKLCVAVLRLPSFTLYLRAISKYCIVLAHRGFYSEGQLYAGFFLLQVWGAKYFQNFRKEKLEIN